MLTLVRKTTTKITAVSCVIDLQREIVFEMSTECFVSPFDWYLQSGFALGIFLITNTVFLIN